MCVCKQHHTTRRSTLDRKLPPGVLVDSMASNEKLTVCVSVVAFCDVHGVA